MGAFLSSCRLTLDKTRLLIRAAKGFMIKSPSKVSEASNEGDNENIDYLPLVSSRVFPGLHGHCRGAEAGGSPRILPCALSDAVSGGLLRAGSLLHPCLPFSVLPRSGWYLRASLCAHCSLQVSLQLACGAFLMNSAFCAAVNIPMEKLKWTSPFACHRLALSPSSSCSTKKTSPSGEHQSLGSSQQLLAPSGHGKSPTTRDIALGAEPEGPSSHAEDTGRLRHFSGSVAESISKALKAEKELSPPAITIRRFSSPESRPVSAGRQAGSGQGSGVDGSQVQALLFDIELQQHMEPEGMLWATAVALAWLEHSSASYFIEWELVAAKASLWLSEQDFPEGYSLATVKAAAQQLFVLLRHWDENLEFNLLCYNPSNV